MSFVSVDISLNDILVVTVNDRYVSFLYTTGRCIIITFKSVRAANQAYELQQNTSRLNRLNLENVVKLSSRPDSILTDIAVF